MRYKQHKQFGSSPSVEVFITEPFGHPFEPDGKIEVNWSCVGSVSIDEAHKFMNHFRQALNYARREAKRLDKGKKAQ